MPTPHRIIHDAFKKLGLPDDAYIEFCRRTKPESMRFIIGDDSASSILNNAFTWADWPGDGEGHEHWFGIHDALLLMEAAE